MRLGPTRQRVKETLRLALRLFAPASEQICGRDTRSLFDPDTALLSLVQGYQEASDELRQKLRPVLRQALTERGLLAAAPETETDGVLAFLSNNLNAETHIPTRTQTGPPQLLHSVRELATITGHAEPIFCVKFSPCGRLLYTGSDDGIVKQWVVDTLLLRKSFRGHNAEIGDIAVSPCSGFLLSGSLDKTLRLWSSQGVALAKVAVHSEAVLCCDFLHTTTLSKVAPNTQTQDNRDDQLLVFFSASTNELFLHQAVVRKSASVTSEVLFPKLKGLVKTFAFSENRDLVLLATSYGALVLYKVDKAALFMSMHRAFRLVVSFDAPAEEVVVSVAIQSGNSSFRLLCAVTERGTLLVYSVANKTPLHQVSLTKEYADAKAEARKHKLVVHRTLFDTNGILVTCKLDSLFYLRVPTFELSLLAGAHSEANVFWAEQFCVGDTHAFISAGADGNVVVWDAANCQPVLVFESQRLEEQDNSSEDILDVAAGCGTAASKFVVVTRFGVVALFGTDARHVYFATPAVQSFEEDELYLVDCVPQVPVLESGENDYTFQKRLLHKGPANGRFYWNGLRSFDLHSEAAVAYWSSFPGQQRNYCEHSAYKEETSPKTVEREEREGFFKFKVYCDDQSRPIIKVRESSPKRQSASLGLPVDPESFENPELFAEPEESSEEESAKSEENEVVLVSTPRLKDQTTEDESFSFSEESEAALKLAPKKNSLSFNTKAFLALVDAHIFANQCWLNATHPQPFFVPQIGDRVVYFPEGHFNFQFVAALGEQPQASASNNLSLRSFANVRCRDFFFECDKHNFENDESITLSVLRRCPNCVDALAAVLTETKAVHFREIKGLLKTPFKDPTFREPIKCVVVDLVYSFLRKNGFGKNGTAFKVVTVTLRAENALSKRNKSLQGLAFVGYQRAVFDKNGVSADKRFFKIDLFSPEGSFFSSEYLVLESVFEAGLRRLVQIEKGAETQVWLQDEQTFSEVGFVNKTKELPEKTVQDHHFLSIENAPKGHLMFKADYWEMLFFRWLHLPTPKIKPNKLCAQLKNFLDKGLLESTQSEKRCLLVLEAAKYFCVLSPWQVFCKKKESKVFSKKELVEVFQMSHELFDLKKNVLTVLKSYMAKNKDNNKVTPFYKHDGHLPDSSFKDQIPVLMGIDLIKKRLENKFYRSLEMVKFDLRLITKNIRQMWGETHAMLRNAENMIRELIYEIDEKNPFKRKRNKIM